MTEEKVLFWLVVILAVLLLAWAACDWAAWRS